MPKINNDPKSTAPTNDTKSNIHPLDWKNDITQAIDRDAINIDSQSIIMLGKQYIQQIREVNKSPTVH